MEKRISAVLFDLDGTLLDSPEGIVDSFFHAFDRHLKGHSFTREDVIKKLGQPLYEMMLFFCKDEDLAHIMTAEYREFNEKLMPDFKLYPNTMRVLSELINRGFTLGIVTSKAKKAAMISIVGHKLDAMCELILTSDDTPKHKPDPMPLIVASEKLELKPEEMIYIGDATHDIECAKAAGCLSAAALWGPNKPQDLRDCSPTYLLNSIAELLEIKELKSN